MIWAFATLGLMIWTLIGALWMFWMFWEGITSNRKHNILDAAIIGPAWLILAGLAMLATFAFHKKN